MANHPTQAAAVILERVAVQNRWESIRWGLADVVPDPGGDVRVVAEDARVMRRLHPGFALTLYPDEAEGYYLNVTSGAPSVFVAVRTDEASGEPYPFQLTLSYNEAARWMDGSERVERALAWPQLAQWMAEWVAQNYKPEPKPRRKPKSFLGKEGRLREKGSR